MKGDELKDFDKVEFVYEKYEQYRDGSWHCKDYLNLQENAKGDHPANMNEYYSKYKKYADISPNADINLCGDNIAWSPDSKRILFFTGNEDIIKNHIRFKDKNEINIITFK